MWQFHPIRIAEQLRDIDGQELVIDEQARSGDFVIDQRSVIRISNQLFDRMLGRKINSRPVNNDRKPNQGLAPDRLIPGSILENVE